jgi:hypothetical protein
MVCGDNALFVHIAGLARLSGSILRMHEANAEPGQRDQRYRRDKDYISHHPHSLCPHANFIAGAGHIAV